MQAVIPLKTASASPVAYDTAIDGLYSVYNAVLKNYPVANAFLDGAVYSQEKWGLQVTNRATQNNAWKTQLSYGVASGVGAFSLYSNSYSFTRSINKIESGNVQAMLYQNGLATLDFDEVKSQIGNVVLNVGTSIMTSTLHPKGYVVTSGGNKFLAVIDGTTVKIYSLTTVGSKYVVNNATPTGTYSLANVINISGAPVRYGFMIAAKGQYVWAAQTESDCSSTNDGGAVSGVLLSISSSGVPSLVGSQVNVLSSGSTAGGGSSGVYKRAAGGAYVIANTAHCLGEAQYGATSPSFGNTVRTYFTVDLSNVAAFTFANVKTDNDVSGTISGAVSGAMIVGYDGTGLLVVTNLGTAGTPDIYRQTAGGWTDTTANYLAPYNYQCRYRNTSAKLSTAASNINVNSAGTGFSIKGAAHSGTLASLFQNVLFIHEADGTNQDDDAGSFKGVYVPTTAIGSTNGSGVVTLKLNGSLIGTKENILSISSSLMSFTVPETVIGTSKLTFLMEYSNLNAQDSKLGYGLTGGTYASPTGNYETSTLNLLIA